MTQTLRILSIDGGGIRGLIPALLLQEIEDMAGVPVHALFDLIVGTSTGAIIAYGLTTPAADASGRCRFRCKDIVELYRTRGERLFSASTPRFMNKGITSSKYDGDALSGVLKEQFADARIADALVPTIATSYCASSRRLVLFKSRRARMVPHRNVPVWEACRASSSAPLYFEPFPMTITPANKAAIQFTLIDGGVAVNNPAIVGMLEAKRIKHTGPIHVVSIGTGKGSLPISYDSVKSGGLSAWGTRIADVLMHAPTLVNDDLLRQMEDESDGRLVVTRLQPSLDSAYADMDDPSHVEALGHVAAGYASEFKRSGQMSTMLYRLLNRTVARG